MLQTIDMNSLKLLQKSYTGYIRNNKQLAFLCLVRVRSEYREYIRHHVCILSVLSRSAFVLLL